MKFTIALLVSLLPMVATAHDYTVGDLVIAHPMARATVATARTSAGYLQITNNGDVADKLIAVEADFPRVMIHDSVMDGDVMKMEHLMSVTLEPGETVSFEPGGKHIMFMGLGGDPFDVGEKIPGTLVFENAGRLVIEFNVEEIVEDHANH
jgi:copper(I)-binding protein